MDAVDEIPCGWRTMEAWARHFGVARKTMDTRMRSLLMNGSAHVRMFRSRVLIGTRMVPHYAIPGVHDQVDDPQSNPGPFDC